MPINKETIISVYDDKLTLMQWLKTINKALEDAVLTGVVISKKGNATLSFKFTFEDGTFLESNDLVLQEGESVNNAYIQNGHLYLTLTNGTLIDAGNVKPVSSFSIDASQHLIVNYGDGTSQDLGAIFNGNVIISGTLNATAITGDSIIENMSGWGANEDNKYAKITNMYIGAVKNGNKVTLALAGVIATGDDGIATYSTMRVCEFEIPSAIGQKLVPLYGNTVDVKKVVLFTGATDSYTVNASIEKPNDTRLRAILSNLNVALPASKNLYFRYEVTFLLSDNFVE